MVPIKIIHNSSPIDLEGEIYINDGGISVCVAEHLGKDEYSAIMSFLHDLSNPDNTAMREVVRNLASAKEVTFTTDW